MVLGVPGKRGQRSGYRVLNVEITDVTPGEPERTKVCETLRIACDARAVSYVRAKLLEMGEALDGVVLET